MKCETIPELKKFLSIQEQALGTGSPEVATTVSKLADLYLDQGMLDDAEALYRRALAIRERLIGPHRSEVEESKRSLNKVLALKGDRLERISAEMKAAGGNSPPHGRSRAAPSSPFRAGAFSGGTKHGATQSQSGSNAQNSQAQAAGKTSPAAGASSPAKFQTRPHSDSSKAVLESWFSQSGCHKPIDPAVRSGSHNTVSFHPSDSSTTLDVIPDSMLLTGNADALIEAIKEARLEVDLVRQLSGADAAQLADCLTRLADLLCRCRRYQEMEPILTEALNIRERRFGLHHQLVATSLKNLARLYYFEAQFDRAQPLFERALTIRRKIFGDYNPRVADILEQYAKLLRKMNRHREANGCDQEAQSIRSRSQGWRPI